MKTILNLIYLFFLSAIFSSCNKEVIAEKGGIDVISNIYFKASNQLDDVQTIHLSKLNFLGKDIVELIPDPDLPGITSGAYFISDSLCYKLNPEGVSKAMISNIRKSKAIKLANKSEGTLFLNDEIPNYRNRKNLSDTILFKKTYKRFEVNSPWSYSRYYIVKTDTILPYSIYKHAERDYGGRLERIDSYNKKEDIFVTLQLIPRKTLDDEAKEFFSFNQYLKKSSPSK